jgi:hypothetical protein
MREKPVLKMGSRVGVGRTAGPSLVALVALRLILLGRASPRAGIILIVILLLIVIAVRLIKIEITKPD